MRYGILIAQLQSTDHLVRRDVAPANLKEVKPIRFAFVLKAVRRNEGRSHSPTS